MSGRINHGTVAWFPSAETVRLGDRDVPSVVWAEIGDPVSGDPMVRIRLEVISDRPQCREVHFVSTTGREIRQGDLDAFRIAEWIERVFVLSAWPTYTSLDEFRAEEPALRAAVTTARKSRQIDRAFLEQVAVTYRRHVDDGAPTKQVAMTFGISHSTAAEYVRRARAAGLLPPTTPGKRKA